MKTKDLRDLGLTDDQVDAVMKLNGQDVNNAKSGVLEELKEKNSRIAALEAEVKTAKEDAEAKFKDYKSPEEHQKVVEELTTLKDASAKATRIAKYKAKGFNTDDEDVANMLDGKFKDSKEEELDKALDAYAKAHPSFLTVKGPSGKRSTFFQGLGGNKGKEPETENQKMNDSIRGAFGGAKEE